MSGSQKVLRTFGIIEIVVAVLGTVGAVMSGELTALFSVAASVLAAILLLMAAKDATKVGGAWIILLVDLILSVAWLVLALSSGADGTSIAGNGVAIVINLIGFIAANNVKKQARGK